MSQANPVSDPKVIAGRYEVEKKLGAGAFGTVYKAKDKILGRMVAIKTIRLEGLAAAGASLEELMDRFKREAQVSAQLKHPNIVTIYDIGEADGMSYLAMEFIDGVGLDRLIHNEGKLSVERAAGIAAQVADALDFAHKNSVVHRDIKPANIMIEAGDRVKVTDFGIAKVTNSGDHLTVTGSLLGTPSYMSPEQARGSELDGRSDLFAVGCVLYEMLAGKKAFRGESITGLIFKIITEEPPSIREIDPTLPEEIAKVLDNALSKSPDKRFQSGRELADALGPFIRSGSQPTIRQVEQVTARSSPGLIKGPATVVSPKTAVAPPTVVASGLPPAPSPAPPPKAPAAPPARSAAPRPAAPPPPMPRPQPKKGGVSVVGMLVGLVIVAVPVLAVGGGAVWYFFLRKPPVPVADLTPAPPSATPLADATAEPVAPPGEATAAATEAPAVATAPPAAETPAPAVTLPPTKAKTPVQVAAATEAPAPPSSGRDFSYLDTEADEGMDGAEQGAAVANTYRSDRGQGSSSYGSRRALRARARSPRDLRPGERPAVATLRYLMNSQEAYKKKSRRYGSFSDLLGARALVLDVSPDKTAFQRAGYRFELSVEDDGESFSINAMPQRPGLRPFLGDDTGFIREPD